LVIAAMMRIEAPQSRQRNASTPNTRLSNSDQESRRGRTTVAERNAGEARIDALEATGERSPQLFPVSRIRTVE